MAFVEKNLWLLNEMYTFKFSQDMQHMQDVCTTKLHVIHET